MAHVRDQVGVVGAALIVAAAIIVAAVQLKPLTPTDRCWDISVTWERQQKAGSRVFGSV